LDDPAFRKTVYEKLALEGPGTPPGDSDTVAEEHEDVEVEEKGLDGDPSPDMVALEAGLPEGDAPPAQTTLSYAELKLKIDALKALGDPNIPNPGLPLLLPVEGHGLCLYTGLAVGCCGSFTDALYMLRTVGPLGTAVSGPICNHCRLRADEADAGIRSVRPGPSVPLDWIPVVRGT
jgi:hypothetical protein